MNEQDKQFTTGSDEGEVTLRLRPRDHTTRAAPVSHVQPHKVPGWGFWVMWALTSGIVGFAIVLLRFAGSVAVVGEVRGALLAFWVLGALVGLLSALAQWVVLHLYIPNLSPSKWTRAVMIGYLLAGLWYIASIIAAFGLMSFYSGFLLFFAYDRARNIHSPEVAIPYAIANWSMFCTGVGISTIIGLAQWVALRRYLPYAQDLIVSNVIAAIVFQLSALVIAYATVGEKAFEGQATADTIISTWTAMLFLSGTVTGVTLIRLLRRPQAGRTRPA